MTDANIPIAEQQHRAAFSSRARRRVEARMLGLSS